MVCIIARLGNLHLYTNADSAKTSRFDAFTHKPTAQYSLAYEKASIIFNISAVLSCHAAYQNRFDETGQKTAYHSFQAAAGMFTYINENFLHAPSTDLSRETVKTLIAIMLAQGQEVFLEKQIADGRKVGLLAKLASQAASLHAQAAEGVQDNVTRGVFDKLWLHLTQVKANYLSSIAQYYQALADDDANSHGTAIARLQIAETEGKDAARIAVSFPSTVSAASNLSSETGPSLVEMTKKHLVNVQERLAVCNKDNDFIYHQTVPAEAALSGIPKLQAAKAIPVSDLYQGQDIQRIIGPDIFQKIVPMSVTESASLYDEEKAKLVRAEAENVETANGEMAASLDYLKLPGSLNVLKGGMDQETSVDEEFRTWCEDLAGHESFGSVFDQLQSERSSSLSTLERCTKQLDMEESICEKMRSKYGGDWTQQPSSKLTSTLRSDVMSYRGAVEEANGSDLQLFHTSRQYESDFDEMRSAGELDEADVLYQRAMLNAGANRGKSRNGIGSPLIPNREGNLLDDDFGEGGLSVMDQITKVEDLLRKLDLIKRDRTQVLKDLKEKVGLHKSLKLYKANHNPSKVHDDDISNVLILNKKSISNHENQLFQSELEKYRGHQNRLLQATHKQTALMKELTKTYGVLLQDKRVKSEQAKYEAFTRQRNSVLTKYKKVFQAFNDLVQGLMSAQSFYSEMKQTAESLEKNIEQYVNNRRTEGANLLNGIEQEKSSSAGSQADRERDRLRELMERMSVDPSASSPTKSSLSRRSPSSRPSQSKDSYSSKSPVISTPFYSKQALTYGNGNTSVKSPVSTASYQGLAPHTPDSSYQQPTTRDVLPSSDLYNPMVYPYQSPTSPPPQPAQSHQQYPAQQNQYLPHGYVPPPPPRGPPPTSQGNFGNPGHPYPSGAGGYAHHVPPRQSNTSQSQADPWSELNAWK